MSRADKTAEAKAVVEKAKLSAIIKEREAKV
jgi:hypothetical protein